MSFTPRHSRRTVAIQPGNYTDKLDIYTIQGDSEKPLDIGNKVLNLHVAKGIQNDGGGVAIDIDFEYDRSGMVKVTAYQGGRALDMETGSVPADCSWMGKPPVMEKSFVAAQRYIILVIDLSGSMCGDPLKEAMEEMCSFAGKLSKCKFALVAFGNTSKQVSGFVDSASILKSIRSLERVNVGSGTSCNPLNKEVYKLAKQARDVKNAEIFVVTLTDGQWYGGAENVDGSIRDLKKMDVRCIGIGFGGVDSAFIRKLSSSDKSALSANYGDLGKAFSSIASDIDGSGVKKR